MATWVVGSLLVGASLGYIWDDIVSGMVVSDAQFLYTMAEKVTQTPFNAALPPFLSGCVGIVGIHFVGEYFGLNNNFCIGGAFIMMDGYTASIRAIIKALTLPEVTYLGTKVTSDYSELVAWYLKQQAKKKAKQG